MTGWAYYVHAFGWAWPGWACACERENPKECRRAMQVVEKAREELRIEKGERSEAQWAGSARLLAVARSPYSGYSLGLLQCRTPSPSRVRAFANRLGVVA